MKCLKCRGTGSTVCKASRCKNGQIECPGKCMKLSVGRWEHMDVAGPDPKELWQRHTGSKGWHAWTSNHVGEVIEIRNGMPENVGKCPTCGGKATVLCKDCNGAGIVVCPACRGTKLSEPGLFPLQRRKSRPPASRLLKFRRSAQAEDHPTAGWRNAYRANRCIGSESVLDKNERWENSRSADQKHHPRHPFG